LGGADAGNADDGAIESGDDPALRELLPISTVARTVRMQDRRVPHRC
jgi:hypothetical protein